MRPDGGTGGRGDGGKDLDSPPIPEIVVDARGLYCPIPILRLAKAFRGKPSGTIALLLATDPASVEDVAVFCREGIHELLQSRNEAAVLSFVVRKGS